MPHSSNQASTEEIISLLDNLTRWPKTPLQVHHHYPLNIFLVDFDGPEFWGAGYLSQQ